MINGVSKILGPLYKTGGIFNEEPIREELYSVERLEQYAPALAAEHSVSRKVKRSRILLQRLEDNSQELFTAYRALSDAVSKEQAITPAAEWLVDNFHIVKEQLREIREDLPLKFYDELPKLENGPMNGLPRIYAVAVALIAHTDSRLDGDTMLRFLRAYQQVSPLSIGELWAVAINLRLALIENLRRLATRIVSARKEREEADKLADKILEAGAKGRDKLKSLLREESGKREKLGRAFVVQLTLRLRDQDPSVTPALRWLEKYLRREGQTTEQIVHLEHQRQAASQVTVGNIITSMRLVSALNWREFFESLSLVEPILDKDPSGVYSKMDFETRDRYRHVIERISKRTGATELEVAKRAADLATEAGKEQKDKGKSHVGYYLIHDGLIKLEKAFNYHPKFFERIKRAALNNPNLTYLGRLFLLASLIVLLLVYYAFLSGAEPLVLVILALLALIPASDLALSALNFDITSTFSPRVLPKMDFSEGIPEEARTMVVVPTLFTSEATVNDLLEKLEVHYLANQDNNLYFALLGDFRDAPEKEMPDDAELIVTALDGIDRLNERYGRGGRHGRFYLFHRRRLWNDSEGKWMGWERKRGKLQEFNHLLRGASDTSFTISTADSRFLSQIRYVITLDSDTQLPRDAARQLVGTIMHPLNQARYDQSVGRVVEGYAILQPRVSISLTSSAGSAFARIFSGHTGIDPYTTAVSDAYQDLYGEGIYTGKGLYDVDAFEAALAARVPENALLSHDLFEGLYARCALVTDIEFLDDYPAHYDTHVKRLHRWARGDWQIARWLFRYVRDAEGRKVKNNLPLISRWKILDNLRRSLVAPTILLLLVFGWTILPGSILWWTLFVVIVLAFPVFAHVTNSLMQHSRSIPWTSHFWHVWGDARTNVAQIVLTTTMLAHQSYLMCDAVLRTLYRKIFSRRNLLEWMTAAQAEASSAHDIKAFWHFMWPAALLSAIAALLILILRPTALPIAAPFLILWALSPFIAEWVSRPRRPGLQTLTEQDAKAMRFIARRTWRFFETFVGAEDNWLPPDNYQEDPQPVIAHRTSPTNMGMLLLASASARDFGYLGSLELLERLELTFSTLEKLARFRGHFFNWYDTRTMEPLSPQYVSTVDSGNLAGHLIVIKQQCLELKNAKLLDRSAIEGLMDTFSLMREEVLKLEAHRQRTQQLTFKQLQKEIDTCVELLVPEPPETIHAWSALFESLEQRLEILQDIVNALAYEHGRTDFEELHFWVGALLHQTRARRRDLNTLTPWGEVPAAHLEPILAQCCDNDGLTQWREIVRMLSRTMTLSDIKEQGETTRMRLMDLRVKLENSLSESDSNRSAALKGLSLLSGVLERAGTTAEQAMSRLDALAEKCERIVEEMDFQFLFDDTRKVFRIGYNASEGRGDNSYYDLLASEARLASFVAIAKGDVPQEHWFRLGRQQTPVQRSRALVAWTATMFEYLMPLLVMRNYEDTLLAQTYEAVIARQIEYGREQNVPWGISESAYNARDLQFNYQYGPFGVPGLGLKRGLSEDLVISPYSTVLAAMIAPNEALKNMRRFEREGVLARYGFYEAIDYTQERLPKKQKRAVIRSFMAHHQGMSLVAIGNLLHEGAIQRRFHADPLVQATELLLQERIPRGVPITRPHAEEVLSGRVVKHLVAPVTRRFMTTNLPTPQTQLLSNGRYSVMVTAGGGGYSICDQLAITRWREDATRDNWGNFIYLRDVNSGAVWSASFQPTTREPQFYEATFSEEKAEFRRRDAGLLTHTEIIVSSEDNAEVRRVSVTNHSSRPREIEVTSYAEVVLATQAADAAHPAFSNLFIETEFISAENALLARRRPRSQKDQPIWGIHVIVTEGEKIGNVQYETDRARFLGRGHSTADPLAVTEDRPLSNTVGAVLDPVFSLRQRILIKPQETARICFTTALAETREAAMNLADKYHDPHIFEREATLAWTRAQVEMRHLNVDSEEANLFQNLAEHLLYSDPSLRPRSHLLAQNTKTQSSLWAYGIGGDLPIVLVQITESQELSLVRQMLRGHEYLRMKGLAFDLVILNNHPPSYAQSLQDELQSLVRASGLQWLQDKPGGIFVRRADIMPEEDKTLFRTVARVVLIASNGSLEEQLLQRRQTETGPVPVAARYVTPQDHKERFVKPELSFFNGLGGFSEKGHEYVTVLSEGQWTPAPWLNVVSNAVDFGFQVTETGAGFTWSANSRENRLTPWSNDAVSDTPGEIVYIRDEDTGLTWTTTPLPIREAEPYMIRHGQGYTIFEHSSHGIAQELLMFAPLDAPVKISILRLRNQSNERRRLSVTSYNELVLGFSRSQTAPFVITEIDELSKAIYARNPYNNEFAKRVAFAYISGKERTVTCDRKEFIGRNGSLAQPAALRRSSLSGRAGAGLDPCSAMQTVLTLAPGETREIVMLLGEGETKEEAQNIIKRFTVPSAVSAAFNQAVKYWDNLLNVVTVNTPDAAMDIMLNRWLLYQTLSCRIWSRSAFYQSGGAYGFRDQLQDVMSLVNAKPEIAREQILRSAARQFKEGDVQHWWHPPTGRGVRTRFSDDLLWLPYVVCFYVNITGDESLFDEVVSFLEAAPLEQGVDEAYIQPNISSETASIFEHCVRAIERSLAVGSHGLPLMGSGDWNDGMSRVGHEGKGESVWVGWFLFATLKAFAPFCDARGQQTHADRYREHLEQLKDALEQEAWDGDWYLRAFFDDGTPLGSARNDECRIDSIAQSWGIISGAADTNRARHAMARVEEYLIRRGDGLVMLFTPPFDKSALDPGYIKGYLPGVRENGGQYTHAAIWTMIAYAMLGDGDRAGELFALLNPINHASTRAGLHKYKIEPYVAAGDVYAVWPHTGRGGWSWYTGSAGWMYRAGLENILGFKLSGNRLKIEPCIPRSWREFEINYRHGDAKTLYHITVENPHGLCCGVASVELDGRALETTEIMLVDDGNRHEVHIILGVQEESSEQLAAKAKLPQML